MSEIALLILGIIGACLFLIFVISGLDRNRVKKELATTSARLHHIEMEIVDLEVAIKVIVETLNANKGDGDETA